MFIFCILLSKNVDHSPCSKLSAIIKLVKIEVARSFVGSLALQVNPISSVSLSQPSQKVNSLIRLPNPLCLFEYIFLFPLSSPFYQLSHTIFNYWKVAEQKELVSAHAQLQTSCFVLLLVVGYWMSAIGAIGSKEKYNFLFLEIMDISTFDGLMNCMIWYNFSLYKFYLWQWPYCAVECFSTV